MEMLSVIVPVYNAALTLPGCVQAVLAQSWGNLELILVNDGSSDDSGNLCDWAAASDARVRVLHQENQGVSAARNLALSQAKGSYITFLDADDIVPPDYLEILYDACRDADIAVCDVVSIQDGRELNRFTHPDGILSQKEALNFLLTRRRINSGPCAKLFRREVLEGLTFPPLKAYEDILFVRDAFCKAQRIAITDRTEYRYIQNPTGAMSGFVKAPSPDIIKASADLMAFIGTRPDLNPETLYITVSHLMQYVLPAARLEAGGLFVSQARALYRSVWKQILRCPAFPWKERIVYTLFAFGCLYDRGKITKV